jgi:thioredoxin 1
MNIIRFLTLMMMFVLFACSESNTNVVLAQLSPSEFQNKLVKEADKSVLVDVRTPGEFEGGHIENALNIDYNSSDFATKLDALDKTKKVFVYCLSGGRSSAAVSVLEQKGFSDVTELDGGMMAWRNSGMKEVFGKATKVVARTSVASVIVSKDLVLLDFFAEWCVPCKKMKPMLTQFEQETKEELSFLRVDADQSAEEVKKYSVNVLPTFVLFKAGKEVWRKEGAVTRDELNELVKKFK